MTRSTVKKCGGSGYVATAILAYADEPCGVCSRMVTNNDLLEKKDVVFTGYRTVNGRVSRSSHGACWRGLTKKERERMKATAEGGER